MSLLIGMMNHHAHAPKLSLSRYLPLVFKLMAGLVALALFAALVVYGVTVYLESHVLQVGRETRHMQEDNQSLEMDLNRLKAYQKVADESAQMHDLHVAGEVIIVEPPPAVRVVLPEPSGKPIPRMAYGY